MTFAILRFQKLKSLAVVDQVVAHLRRDRETLNADGTKTNIWLTRPPDGMTIGEAVAERLPTKRRRDAVLAMEAVLSASPAHFRPDDPSAAGQWKEERTRDWIHHSYAWLRDEFGDRLIGAVAHLDEATPHIQAVIVPLDEGGRLCAKRMFDPDALRRMQTTYARAVAPLGIERGIEGSVATHVHVRDWYPIVQAAYEPPELSTMDRLSLAAGKLPQTIVDLQSQAESARLVMKERDEAKAIVAKLARELDEAKHQANLVRTVPLDRVMAMLGGVNDAADKWRWTLPSLGATIINKDKPYRFYSERLSKGGGGAIDLVVAETGWDARAAVRFLGTELAAADIAADAAHMAALRETGLVQGKLTQQPASLEDRAPAAEGERSVVEAALVANGIDPAIIQNALATGDLEATRQGDRVFSRWTLRDGSGNAVGFSLEDIDGNFRATRGRAGIFACDAEFQASDLFPDDSPQLWVSKSPSEAMSAMSAFRSIAIPALEPERRARAVATINYSEAALDAVAAMATRERATVVIATASSRSGEAMATKLAARLHREEIKHRSLAWALNAIGAADWVDAAKKLAGAVSIMLTQIQATYAKLVAAAKSPPAPSRNRGD